MSPLTHLCAHPSWQSSPSEAFPSPWNGQASLSHSVCDPEEPTRAKTSIQLDKALYVFMDLLEERPELELDINNIWTAFESLDQFTEKAASIFMISLVFLAGHLQISPEDYQEFQALIAPG